MIKAIVVEDEWYNLEEISDLIEQTGFMKVEEKYSNPLKALEEFNDISPQVAFIDIDMPEMDGITLAEELMEQDPTITIVFITAYNQYAVKAFDINALDYIMKPINIQRFNSMVEKIKNKINISTYVEAKALKIKCFEKLETSIDGKPVKWERIKAEELFAYLVMNYGSYVHKAVIIEYLWPEYEPQKALQILQTTIHKIRKIFAASKGQITIDYRGSKYCLIIKDVECDYVEFEKAITNYRVSDKATYESIENSFKEFSSGFLTLQGYIWSIEKNEELKAKLILILKEISEVYLNEKNYEDLLKYLKYIAQIIPYEEDVNYKLLKIMMKLKKYNEISTHYEWLERVLKDEYDTVPSAKIVKLYNRNNK